MNSANNNIKISDGNKRNADTQVQTSPWISERHNGWSRLLI